MSDYLRQQELEEESTALGIKRYQENLQKRGDLNTVAGVQLVERAISPMADSIKSWVDDVKAGRVRRQASLVKFIDEFEGDYDAIAFISARICIGAVTKERALTITATALGRKLEDELEYRQLAKDAGGLYRTLLNQLKDTSHEDHRRKVVMHAKSKYEIIRPKWGNTDRIRLGTILIHMFSEATQLMVVTKVRESKKMQVYKIQPTESTTEWLRDAHARGELLAPVHLPMVVPPRPWRDVYGGGYLNTPQFKLKLIKSRNANYLEEISNSYMPEVYESVNTLQNTPWKVNGAVLKIMREVWDEGSTLGNIPPREGNPLPAKPSDIETNEEARTVWKRKAALVHAGNARMVSKRLALASKLWMAEKFINDEAIYYVWTLDWRGRAYPLASFMHPQADDTGKALLQFAEGKPLGETGGYWLAVHIAGLFGVDKCSFDERVQWVQENTEEILDSALKPLDGNRFWATADKPWCALAGCFEWLGFTISGEDYVSHLPVAMDGSCNGLQNFSTMLRDEIREETSHSKILLAKHSVTDMKDLNDRINEVIDAIKEFDNDKLKTLLKNLAPSINNQKDNIISFSQQKL